MQQTKQIMALDVDYLVTEQLQNNIAKVFISFFLDLNKSKIINQKEIMRKIKADK